MATYTKIANLKGPQGDKGDKGDAGTFVSASAESVSAASEPEAIIGGTPAASTVHFKIPEGRQGLPGVNAVANDTAVASYMADPDSATSTQLNATLAAPPVPQINLLSSPDPLADTKRLRILSQQKQEAENNWDGGEVAWLDVDPRAKAMLTWRLAIDPDNPRKPYPLSLLATTPPPDSAYKRIVWAGAHWFAQDKPSGDMDEATQIHGHWSVEVPDVDMSLRTRFQVFYNDREDPTLIGTSAALISTSRADFRVVGGMGLDGTSRYGRFTLEGGNAFEKMVEFSRSGNDAGVRWKIGTNTSGESGTGNATGSDFELRRYDDSGTLLGTSLAVQRLTGSVVVGNTAWEPSNDAGQLVVRGGGDVSGILVRPTEAFASGAAFKARLTGIAEQLLVSRISTNGSPRFRILGDGRHEWGSATTLDTVLYRSAAGRLATDGEFDIATNVRVGGMTVGNSQGVLGLANAAQVSSSSPTGGAWLYADAGAVTVKNTGGTVIRLAQQNAIANATDDASAITQLNALLAALRTIGLIAS